MSRTATVGIVSFVLGFLCSLLLFSDAHWAILGTTAVEAAPQDLETSPSAIWGPGFANSIPRVPPLPEGTVNGGLVTNAPQSLDGLTCTNCRFVNSDLIYAGGPFRLANISVSGTTHLKLQGAAANTPKCPASEFPGLAGRNRLSWGCLCLGKQRSQSQSVKGPGASWMSLLEAGTRRRR